MVKSVEVDLNPPATSRFRLLIRRRAGSESGSGHHLKVSIEQASLPQPLALALKCRPGPSPGYRFKPHATFCAEQPSNGCHATPWLTT